MTLKERVLKAFVIEDQKQLEADLYAAGVVSGPGRFRFAAGAKHENNRLMPLIHKLLEVAEAADKLRHGKDWDEFNDGSKELADQYDQALKELRESVD